MAQWVRGWSRGPRQSRGPRLRSGRHVYPGRSGSSLRGRPGVRMRPWDGQKHYGRSKHLLRTSLAAVEHQTRETLFERFLLAGDEFRFGTDAENHLTFLHGAIFAGRAENPLLELFSCPGFTDICQSPSGDKTAHPVQTPESQKATAFRVPSHSARGTEGRQSAWMSTSPVRRSH